MPLTALLDRIVERLARSKVVEPIISDEIEITSTAVTAAVVIPAGSYVFRVGVHCTEAIANADFDIGDSSDPNRYIDAVTTMAENDIVFGGTPATPVTGVPCGGHYYASADTIDLDVNTASSTGKVKIMVWYHK